MAVSMLDPESFRVPEAFDLRQRVRRGVCVEARTSH